jgi:hypothetical protein
MSKTQKRSVVKLGGSERQIAQTQRKARDAGQKQDAGSGAESVVAGEKTIVLAIIWTGTGPGAFKGFELDRCCFTKSLGGKRDARSNVIPGNPWEANIIAARTGADDEWMDVAWPADLTLRRWSLNMQAPVGAGADLRAAIPWS